MFAEAEPGSDKALDARDSPLAASGLLCRETATTKFSTFSSSPSLVLRLAAKGRRLAYGFVFAARSSCRSPIARTTSPGASNKLQLYVPYLTATSKPVPVATNVLDVPK